MENRNAVISAILVGLFWAYILVKAWSTSL